MSYSWRNSHWSPFLQRPRSQCLHTIVYVIGEMANSVNQVILVTRDSIYHHFLLWYCLLNRGLYMCIFFELSKSHDLHIRPEYRGWGYSISFISTESAPSLVSADVSEGAGRPPGARGRDVELAHRRSGLVHAGEGQWKRTCTFTKR